MINNFLPAHYGMIHFSVFPRPLTHHGGGKLFRG